MADFKAPFISISIVNLDGKAFLSDCLDSIEKLDYPQDMVEVIVVDNGSSDGSVEMLKKDYPRVNIIANPDNYGFAPANNQAARAAKGEYMAFLNNDTKVDKDWLIELVRPVYGDSTTVCSGSKVLSMDKKTIDFVGGMLNFEGKGFQTDYGISVEQDRHFTHRFSPFVNGGAMLIDRKVFLDIGGFDDDFFAYYEDVDLGWRLWVLGYKVLFCPSSIVYHAHHGTSGKFSEERLRFLKERNSLIMVYKNYEEKNLSRMASLSQLSLYNRVFMDYEPSGDKDIIERWPASSLAAYKDFRAHIQKHRKKREFIQKNRKRPDERVFSYFKGWYLSSSSLARYQEDQTVLIGCLGAAEIFRKQIDRTILMIVPGSSEEILCRYLLIARVLSEYMEVIIALPEGVEVSSEFEVTGYSAANMTKLVASSDIIYTDYRILSGYPLIKRSENHIILDCSQIGLPRDEKELLSLNESFYYGDLFVCEGGKQKDLIIGMLSALGRINPYIFIEDPTLKKLVSDVSQAVPSTRPISLRDVFSEMSEISAKDFIVMDMASKGKGPSCDDYLLIDAVAHAQKKKKDIKGLFLGFRGKSLEDLRDYAKRNGVLDKKTFFIEEVEKSSHIADYLSAADVCFAGSDKRSKDIIDVLWAEIPLLAIGGSEVSVLVEEEGIGKVCKSNRIPQALIGLFQDTGQIERFSENIISYKKRSDWEISSAPIIDFCTNPVARAKRDRQGKADACGIKKVRPQELGYFRKLLYHLRYSGIKRTLKYSSNFIRGR